MLSSAMRRTFSIELPTRDERAMLRRLSARGLADTIWSCPSITRVATGCDEKASGDIDASPLLFPFSFIRAPWLARRRGGGRVRRAGSAYRDPAGLPQFG